MDEWISFEGTAEKNGDAYRLTAKQGGGVIELQGDAVSSEGSKVKIKTGAIAKIVKESTGVKPETFTALAGCRQTQCVGLILICCDDGRAIGPCLGAWGCS